MAAERPMSRRAVVAVAAAIGIALVGVAAYWVMPLPKSGAPRSPAAHVPTAPVSPAAERLLSQLDAGDYDAVFDEMASRFREGVQREHFLASMRLVRADLGQVRQRTLKGESAAERDPQGRVGPFRMHQYVTVFDGGARTEVLVLVAEGDAWRFYSYNTAPVP
jgi:hypothetical protein